MKSDDASSPLITGFDAKVLSELAPDASVSWDPRENVKDEQGLSGKIYGYDPDALVVVLFKIVADLTDRIEILEKEISTKNKYKK
jgi:hypothetical protein